MAVLVALGNGRFSDTPFRFVRRRDPPRYQLEVLEVPFSGRQGQVGKDPIVLPRRRAYATRSLTFTYPVIFYVLSN